MMISVAPVVEADADLQDAVVEPADRCARSAPQGLEGLVLIEELAGIELLDAADQRRGRRFRAAGTGILVDLATNNALGWPCRLPLAASGLWRVRRRGALGISARRG